jgi:hypothetical protein
MNGNGELFNINDRREWALWIAAGALVAAVVWRFQ